MLQLAALTVFALADPRAPVVRESRAGEAYVIDGTFSVAAPPQVIFKETAIHLLTELRDEINKRAALAAAGDPP